MTETPAAREAVASVRDAIRTKALDRFLSDTLAEDARDWIAGFAARAAYDALLPFLAEREAAARGEALRNPYNEDGYCEGCGNGSWKAHAPECGWADLRDAKAEAWDEGQEAGMRNYVSHRETGRAEFANPYRAALSDREA